MKNRKNMFIHDAKQNVTHSFLMDMALQYLEGIQIRINIYFREINITPNISRNTFVLQINILTLSMC